MDYSSEFSHTILHNFHPLKRSSNANKTSSKPSSISGGVNEIVINRDKRVFSSAQTKKPLTKESYKASSSKKKTEILQKKTALFTRNKEASPTRISDVYKSSLGQDTKTQDKNETLDSVKNSIHNSDLKKLRSEVNKVTIDISKPFERNSNLRTSDPNRLSLINDPSKTPNKKHQQKKNHSLDTAHSKEKQEEEKNSKKIENSVKLKEMLKNMNKKQKPKSVFSSRDTSEEQSKKQNPFINISNNANSENVILTEENTDVKDYLNSHKMLMEMDEIQRGEINEIIKEIKPEINKENFNLNDVMKDEGYIDTKIELIKTQEVASEKNEETIDSSKTDTTRTQLEATLGIEVLSKVLKIVDESIASDSFSYNHEVISKNIIKELMGTVDSSLVLISIDKIPELFSLAVKERDVQWKKIIV